MDREPINHAIAAELRTRRAIAGRTAEEMQALLGWSRSTYKRTEARRRLYVDELFEVAAVLGIDPDELVGGIYQRLLSGSRPPPGVAIERPGVGDEWRGAFGLD